MPVTIKLDPVRWKKQTTPTNCFRACVASILGVTIREVPEACDGASWDWLAFQNWLYRSFRLQAVEVLAIDDDGKIRERLYPISHPIPVIITGKSPRGDSPEKLHAVLAEWQPGCERGFELVFDPHESNEFIDGVPSHIVFFTSVSGA